MTKLKERNINVHIDDDDKLKRKTKDGNAMKKLPRHVNEWKVRVIWGTTGQSKSVTKKRSKEQLLEKGERRSMRGWASSWHAAHFTHLSLPFLSPVPVLSLIFLLVSSFSNFFLASVVEQEFRALRSDFCSCCVKFKSELVAEGQTRIATADRVTQADLNENFVWDGTSGVRYFVGCLPVSGRLFSSESFFLSSTLFSLSRLFPVYSPFALYFRLYYRQKENPRADRIFSFLTI